MLIVILAVSNSFAQDMITVQCTDRLTGRLLNSNHIKEGVVYLKKADGSRLDFGPIKDGKFEIEKDCRRGDKYTIIIDQGDYEGYSLYCHEIEKLGNKFPLFNLKSLANLSFSIEVLGKEEFTDVKLKNASIAFMANTMAYISKSEDTTSYNEMSKLAFTSLGSVFEVDEPTIFDSRQGLWVPTEELENAILIYKKANAFSEVNAQADYKLFNSLTGLKAVQLFQSTESLKGIIVESTVPEIRIF